MAKWAETPNRGLNTSGIRPVEYYVLVLPQEVETRTKGGLLIPDETKEREEFAQIEGVLVAMSPMAFAFADWPKERAHEKPKIGARVIFRRYDATELTGRDGRKYWLMKDRSISGVIDE